MVETIGVDCSDLEAGLANEYAGSRILGPDDAAAKSRRSSKTLEHKGKPAPDAQRIERALELAEDAVRRRRPRREYKTVALETVSARAAISRSHGAAFAETFADVLNRNAEDGWSYVRAEDFTSSERRGFLNARRIVHYKILVFERRTIERDPHTTEVSNADDVTRRRDAPSP